MAEAAQYFFGLDTQRLLRFFCKQRLINQDIIIKIEVAHTFLSITFPPKICQHTSWVKRAMDDGSATTVCTN